MARLRLIPEVSHHSAAENSALKALANRSPKLQLRPTLTEGAPTAPVSPVKPSQVVTGVGLSTAVEEALTQRVATWLAFEHRMQAAKQMKTDLMAAVSDHYQRGEISRRFWRLWIAKHEDRPTLQLKIRKSSIDDFEKSGGPFIGPKGGKWADAAHTIPWKESSAPEKKRFQKLTPQKVADDLKRETGMKASYRHPRLGDVRSGFKATKYNPTTVLIEYDLHTDAASTGSAEWSGEFKKRWGQVLDAAETRGYTLVANVASSDRVIGGKEARKVAEQNGIVALVRESSAKKQSDSMKKSFAVGTVRQWSDGKSYKKVAAGKWEPAEALPPESLGLKLPQKGIAYSPVSEGKAVVAKVQKKTPASSDQPHHDLPKLMKEAKAILPGFQKLVGAIGQSTKGKPKHGPLKKQERAEQKIRTDYGGDASKLKDVVRSSLVYNKVSEVYAALDKISNTKGIEIVRVKDRISKPIPGGYRDIMLNVKIDGHVCELQLHISSIIQVKKAGHKLYDQVRNIQDKVQQEGRAKYSVREMKKIAALMKKSEAMYGNAFRKAQ